MQSCIRIFPSSSLFFLLVYSVASYAAAPLQIKDSNPNGERETEISHKSTSARQSDPIPEPG